MCVGEQRTLLYCGTCQEIVNERVDPTRPCQFVERNRAAARCQTRSQPDRTLLLQEPCHLCREKELRQADAAFYSHQRRRGEATPALLDSEEDEAVPLSANRIGRQEPRHNNHHFAEDHHRTGRQEPRHNNHHFEEDHRRTGRPEPRHNNHHVEEDHPLRRPQSTEPLNEHVAAPRDRGRPAATAPARDNVPIDEEAVRQAIMLDLHNRGVISREQRGSNNTRRLIDAALPAFLADDHAGYESAVELYMEAMGPPLQAEPPRTPSPPHSTARGSGRRRHTVESGSHGIIRDASGRLCEVRSKKGSSKRKST